MKRLEFIQLLTCTRKLDRFTGDSLHAQGCATARIAVEFGENRTSDVERLIEMGRDVYSLLAGGSIEHEQNLLRFHEITQAHEFLHERFINLETTSGIKDDRV